MFCRTADQLDEVLSIIKNTAQSLLRSCPQGVDIEVKEHKHKRTQEQNAYYWLFNSKVTDFLNDSGVPFIVSNLELNINYVRPWNKDDIHDINKKVFGLTTTTQLDIKEFCKYMTQLIIFWVEKTGGNFEMSELPANYLERKGYTSDYLRNK